MKDIALDNSNDLKIINGDFVVSDSAGQCVQLILISKQGEWKEFPQVGCDIEQAKNGVIGRFLERDIRVQLEADGFSVEKLRVTEKGVELKGDYA